MLNRANFPYTVLIGIYNEDPSVFCAVGTVLLYNAI